MNEREMFMETMNDVRDSLVIVEGKKDVNLLRSVGVKNTIPLNGRPVHEVADQVADVHTDHESVIILTDFDREGRRLASQLRTHLQRHRVQPNTRLRRELMAFGRTTIEGFSSLVDPLAGEEYKE